MVFDKGREMYFGQELLDKILRGLEGVFVIFLGCTGSRNMS